MNPRNTRTVALPKPTETERGQLYFQRYAVHLPTAGEVVLFDRSWYNRAGVERVMGFCTEDQLAIFLREAPEFEGLLVRDGIKLFKFYLTIGREMQLKRFYERRSGSLEAMEALGRRSRVAQQIRRLHEGRDRDVPLYAHGDLAVDRGPRQRPAPRASRNDPPRLCSRSTTKAAT